MAKPENVFDKDPDDTLDYVFDWAALTNGNGESDWLASGETISSVTMAFQTGITEDSTVITDSDTSVTTTISGGTAGNTYSVACKITTSASQIAERTAYIKVVEK